MGRNRLIRSLLVKNLLSFGREERRIRLEPLNVLIGPNSAGKSNLIEVLGLLRATPKDLGVPIREGGGIVEWLWKGGEANPVATIEAEVYSAVGKQPLRYRLCLTRVGQRTELVDEVVEDADPRADAKDVYFYYRYQAGRPVLNVRAQSGEEPAMDGQRVQRFLRREDLQPDQSVLSQRKDPDQYPELTYLGEQFDRIRLYREWNIGRRTDPRQPQPADAPGDFLMESASNLGLVLNDLEHRGDAGQVIRKYLRAFYDGFEDISVHVHGGTVQLFLRERGIGPIPATRLSDGTVRYLCLLSILCHPSPPPLVCIEEPELGMHPDVLPTLADLLADASLRTQLVVTTHSDVLVSALSQNPNSVLVCEPDKSGTLLRRLDPETLASWLEKYSLGELWRMGELGGNP